MNEWYYDQFEISRVVWILASAFKRVRRFPTNQRFEPFSGDQLFLSDAAGDPMLTSKIENRS